MDRKGGFTLIELLVVVAVVGLFAAVVLSVMSSSRLKAYDGAIKSGLSNLRNAAGIYFDNNKDYGSPMNAVSDCDDDSLVPAGSFFRDPQVLSILENVKKNSGVSPKCLAPAAGGGAASFAVEAALRSDPSKKWCLDSSGVSAAGGVKAEGGAAKCDPSLSGEGAALPPNAGFENDRNIYLSSAFAPRCEPGSSCAVSDELPIGSWGLVSRPPEPSYTSSIWWWNICFPDYSVCGWVPESYIGIY